MPATETTVMKSIFFITLLLTFQTECIGQEETGNAQTNYWSLGVFYDQDYTLEMIGLKKLNEDRNYTLGLGIYFSDPSLGRTFLFAPHRLLNRVFRRRELNSASTIPALMIANGSFTPDSLPAYDPIFNDRPYSSLTYLQTITTYVDNQRYRSYSSAFTLGVLGTYISREVQTYIHSLQNDNDTKNPRTPRGWSNQISNGGEVTLTYSFKKEKLLTKKYISEESKTSVTAFEFKHGWQTSLGYYTYATYEMNFRAGKIDPRHWTYVVNPLSQSNRAEFSDSTLQQGMMKTNYYDRPKTFELYVFGSGRPAFILYNALLNGQFRNSVHVLNFQEMNHLVFDFDAGIGSSIPVSRLHLLELKLKLSGRSPEFELPGRPPRWHYWGGIELLFSRN
jgi:hypothetical protein